MDYEKACRTLLQAIGHCCKMVRIIQEAPGARELETAIAIENILTVLENVRARVSADILRCGGKEKISKTHRK